jgi:hypothetical protein
MSASMTHSRQVLQSMPIKDAKVAASWRVRGAPVNALHIMPHYRGGAAGKPGMCMCMCMCMWTGCVCDWVSVCPCVCACGVLMLTPPPHCPSRLSPDEAEEAKLSGEGGGVDGASGEAAAGEAEGGAGAGVGAGGDKVPAKSWYAATTPKSRRTRRDPPLSSTSASRSNLHNLDTSTLLSMEKVGLVPSLLAAGNVRHCRMLAAVRLASTCLRYCVAQVAADVKAAREARLQRMAIVQRVFNSLFPDVVEPEHPVPGSK